MESDTRDTHSTTGLLTTKGSTKRDTRSHHGHRDIRSLPVDLAVWPCLHLRREMLPPCSLYCRFVESSKVKSVQYLWYVGDELSLWRCLSMQLLSRGDGKVAFPALLSAVNQSSCRINSVTESKIESSQRNTHLRTGQMRDASDLLKIVYKSVFVRMTHGVAAP